MKIKKQPNGTANTVGITVRKLKCARSFSQKDFIAKLQVMGFNINPTSYSKLESQIRSVKDKELYIIAKAFNIPLHTLFEGQNKDDI